MKTIKKTIEPNNAENNFIDSAASSFGEYLEKINNLNCTPINGRVVKVIGLVIESSGPKVGIGDICEIITQSSDSPIIAEVVGFKDERVLLMPVGDIEKISPGCPVIAKGKQLRIGAGKGLLGRVLDGFGNPIDGKGKITVQEHIPVKNKPPAAMSRKRITEPLCLGIRAIDCLLTVGKGQRMGIFAGSGVGKSTLLGMIARNTSADVNVIALIGERGREVMEFIERDLGETGLTRSIVVAVTSDEPALVRIKGAYVATAIAEYFRNMGQDVNLMLDSITRFCMAKREVGLSIGEPPATKGYPPSVFNELPKILERAGTGEKGSITGLYTVLVEGDDMNEPVSDAVRSILDGHIVLSRDLANLNQYPPIDVLASVSRLMADIVDKNHRDIAGRVNDILATYRKSADLIEVGAYVNGTNPRLDYSIRHIDKINDFLKQDLFETDSIESGLLKLKNILEDDQESNDNSDLVKVDK